MNTVYSITTNFIALIREIATAYHLDLDRDYLSLRLDKDNSDNAFLIEKLDEQRGVISSFKGDKPLITLEFLIQFYELMDEDSEESERESWYPLSLAKDGKEPRLIASSDSMRRLMAYDEEGMREAAELCLHWWRQLEQQEWHHDGEPAPDVTATIRHAKYQTLTDKLSDAPVLEFEGDYRIKANRLGLYALVGSATQVLAQVSGNGNGNGTTVFDLQAGVHQLQVELFPAV